MAKVIFEFNRASYDEFHGEFAESISTKVYIEGVDEENIGNHDVLARIIQSKARLIVEEAFSELVRKTNELNPDANVYVENVQKH